ncbi:MAG TPA: M48 family metallopeptidase [Thermoleophilaceae bacterium]|nr:M48 family metallopeptidase [Thermoleophilaceae bacterium]
MLGHRYRLPLALVGAAIAAGGATLLLRPRSGVVSPAPASASDYFTPDQLDRAHDFRAPQRTILLVSLALEGAAVLYLIARPPAALERLGRRPIGGAAAAGAALSIGLTVVALPLSALSEQRSRDAGLSTQSWASWAGDAAKSTAIGAGMSAGGAAVAIALIRRSPRRWWIPASAAVVGFSTLLVFASPVVIDPLFNKFTPLPDGRLRIEVLGLAKRANVDVGQVYRVDASRRTTATNAYVWGLGRTKRVVLYDTLLRDYPDDQVRSVVAHELSHVVHKDVPRGLLWLAIVAPAGTFLVKVLAERLNRGRSLGLPVALPALALAIGIVSTGYGVAGNVLSRRVEERADTYALDLTQDPAAFIGLTRSLAVTNLADPSTPKVFQILFGTHPTTLQRIGAGLEWAREN